VPMDRAKSARHQLPSGRPTDPRWIPLGPLHHTSAGVISFGFDVPVVSTGDYALGVWCRQCAPPRGATFTLAYPGTPWRNAQYSKALRIARRERPPPPSSAPAISRSRVALVAVALGLIGCLGLCLARASRSGGAS
jgi:hypothetical protein